MSILRSKRIGLIKQTNDLFVRTKAQRPKKNAGQEFLLPVQPDKKNPLAIVFELNPGATIGNDLANIKTLPFARPEKDAGRSLELADDHTLDPIKNKCPLVGH